MAQNIYCHQNLDIISLQKVNHRYAIGLASNLKQMVLFNHENIIIDTLSFRGRDFIIQGINIINEYHISYNALNEAGILSISNDELTIEKSQLLNHHSLPYFGVYFLPHGAIGWKRMQKDKTTISYAYFYFDEEDTLQLFESLPKRSEFNGSKKIISNFYYDTSNEILSIPIESASAICFFDVNSKKIEIIHLPKNELKSQSWYAYFDSVHRDYYLVLFDKNVKQNTVYRTTYFQNLQIIKQIDFVPHAIVNGSLHKVFRDHQLDHAWCNAFEALN